MPQQERLLEVYYLTYTCDKCGEGEMQDTGETSTAYYETGTRHYCSKCSASHLMDTSYPRRIYRDAKTGAEVL
jgi:hypothetical protein